VLRMRRPDPRTIVVAVAGLAAAAVAVVALHPGTTTLKAVERHFRTGDTIDGAAALAVISVTWWALFAIGFALLVVFRRWLPVTAMAAARSLLVVADAAHVFRGYQPMVPERAVFPTVHKTGAIGSAAMSGDAVNEMIRRRAEQAGFSPAHIALLGGHSLRAGFVTEAFRQGADAHSIMRQTGHRSPVMLEVYAREHAPLTGNAVTRLGL